ncbi:MAG TPA: tetratricopeptide repeat protein [Gemmatimonadota bacterium]
MGRERELAEAARLLATTRLLTFTGPGGAGKTRLALQLASAQAARFPDGSWWIELAPLTDPVRVPEVTAATLGLAETRGASHAQALATHLRERRALLVLDNCEHVIEAVAALADGLLRECPSLHILATSREPLAIAGETSWVVQPLSNPPADALPPLDDLLRFEGVRLFTERAAAVLPSFRLTDDNRAAVVRICQRLDGLPLAIELAAARIRTLSAEQIAARLDDRFGFLTTGSRTAPPRQRTLRAALDWSHELLTDPERVLLRRLAVFAGGFSLEAAEGIGAGGDIPPGEVLELLSHLVAKSLVGVESRDGGARYAMLETIREYARERLDESGEAPDTRARHAAFFTGVVRDVAGGFLGPDQRAHRAQLEVEHDNLLAALSWTLEHGDNERALRLVEGLWRFWLTAGHLSEGRRWLERVLESSAGAAPARRVGVLSGAGYLAMTQGDYDRAEIRMRESLELARELGDSEGMAGATMNLGSVAKERGDLDRALALYEESLALNRRLSRSREVAAALMNMGAVLHLRGETGRARGLYEESLAVFREIRYPEGIAVALNNLGQLALVEEDHAQAEPLLKEALALLGELGHGVHVCEAIGGLAEIAAASGDLPRAARLWGAAEALRESLGRPRPPSDVEAYTRRLDAASSRLDAEEWRAAWEEGRALTPEAAITDALEKPRLEAGREEQAATGVEAATPASPPALRVLALGALHVYRGEQLLTTADWEYAKPRELFLYLLCHSPRTKEQIGLALWPEVSTEQLRRNLHVTLHHARRALGQPAWIVYEGGRYAFNRTLAYEFDVERFRANLQRAKKEETSGSEPGTGLRALEEAERLYRGDFLEEGVPGDWYVEIQEELRRLYLEVLIELGQLRSAAGLYGEAADAFRRALARDSLQEAAHRGLMLSHARAGERAQALRYYQEVVDLLRAETGSPPTPETTALWERLRRGEDV